MENELSEKWRELLRTYYRSLDIVSGTGSRGQLYVDNAYKELQKFSQDHPEYRSQLPRKHRVQDDGAFGLSYAVARAWRQF